MVVFLLLKDTVIAPLRLPEAMVDKTLLPQLLLTQLPFM
jgi:hypothetical protein